jgi:hypothetical protein
MSSTKIELLHVNGSLSASGCELDSGDKSRDRGRGSVARADHCDRYAAAEAAER